MSLSRYSQHIREAVTELYERLKAEGYPFLIVVQTSENALCVTCDIPKSASKVLWALAQVAVSGDIEEEEQN